MSAAAGRCRTAAATSTPAAGAAGVGATSGLAGAASALSALALRRVVGLGARFAPPRPLLACGSSSALSALALREVLVALGPRWCPLCTLGARPAGGPRSSRRSHCGRPCGRSSSAGGRRRSRRSLCAASLCSPRRSLLAWGRSSSLSALAGASASTGASRSRLTPPDRTITIIVVVIIINIFTITRSMAKPFFKHLNRSFHHHHQVL